MQSYPEYHDRYLLWDCQNKHNSSFFDKCCHPLLVGFCLANLVPYLHTYQNHESLDVLTGAGCDSDCDDGESPVTSSVSSSPLPTHTNPAPKAALAPAPSPSPTTSSAKFRNVAASAPAPAAPSSSPPVTTSTHEAAPSPSPTSSNNNGNSGSGNSDVHAGGQYVLCSLFLYILLDHSPRLPRATFFYQGGAAGACGQVHSDNDFICAMGEYPLDVHFNETHSR